MSEREVLSAEQLGREGENAYRRGDFGAAERSFLAAADSYRAAGQELMALEMQNNRSVVLLAAGRASEALQAAENCAEKFAEAGDVKRRALALGNQAAALEALKRLDEALLVYQQSADLLKRIGESELRLYVMQAISKIQFRSGRQLQALASMQAGVEGLKKPTLKQRLLKRLLRLPLSALGAAAPPPEDGST